MFRSPIFALSLLLAAPVAAQDGQDSMAMSEGGDGQSAAVVGAEFEAAIATSLTWRSHSIGAGAQANSLEGNACTGGTRMVSGACHPGYSDRVVIVNQYPNIAANTWRCGFRNNTGSTRTVWIYTLCAQ